MIRIDNQNEFKKNYFNLEKELDNFLIAIFT